MTEPLPTRPAPPAPGEIRQFVKCAFGGADAGKPGRTYTYHFDWPRDGGEPLRTGDRVIVETRHGGNALVEVVEDDVAEPKFPTKPARKVQAEVVEEAGDE